jgi:hypothetical protein
MPTQLPEHIRIRAQEHAKISATVANDPTIAVAFHGGGYHYYHRDAWTPPVQQPFLPWKAPPAPPIAFVDPDGVVTYPETEP